MILIMVGRKPEVNELGLIAGKLSHRTEIGADQPSMIITQSSGQIVHVSDQCSRLLGVDKAVMLGRDLREFIPAPLPPRLYNIPRARKRMWEEGTWINHAVIQGIKRQLEVDLVWRSVPMGWVSYWHLAIRETGTHDSDYPMLGIRGESSLSAMPSFMLLNHDISPDDNWQIMSFNRPVGDKGGDVLLIDEPGSGYLLYFLGDVAGHHKGAILVRMMLTTYLRVYREEFNPREPGKFPGKLLSRINNALVLDEHNDCLLTANAIVIEKYGNRAWFASAGHQPAILLKSDGTQEKLTTPDIPLGIREKNNYRIIELECGSGDRLMTYTDGLINSGPAFSHRSGLKALLNTLEAGSAAPLDVLTGQIQQLCLNSSRDLESCRDDITFSVISRRLKVNPLISDISFVN